MPKVDAGKIREIEKLIAKNKIQDFSIRIIDLPGRWIHFTVPGERFIKAGKLSGSFFTDGVAFDGSSIEGFKTIDQSDLIALPDIESVVVDPVATVPTLIFSSNLVDPVNGVSYWRDTRAVAI